MIELKIHLASYTALAAAAKALAGIDGVTTDAPAPGIDGVTTDAPAPGIAITLSPAAQQAARDSVAAGTAAGATGKPPKETKTKDKPAPAPEPAAPPAEPKLPTYEESGVAPLITKAQAKNVEATKALLRELGAITPEGKIKGSAMPPANFADALVKLQAIIDAPESME